MHMKWMVAAVALPAVALAVVASRRQSEAATSEPAGVPVARVASPPSALPATDGLQLVVAPAGNEARYRIREQLVGVDLPNDAIGVTSDVTGGIAFDAAGNLVPGSSKFIVNVTGLKSDKDRRDGYVRGRILETSQYPTVELTPTTIRGLALRLPTSGNKTFQIVGDLTVHGVTKPTTWNVTASPTASSWNIPFHWCRRRDAQTGSASALRDDQRIGTRDRPDPRVGPDAICAGGDLALDARVAAPAGIVIFREEGAAGVEQPQVRVDVAARHVEPNRSGCRNHDLVDIDVRVVERVLAVA